MIKREFAPAEERLRQLIAREKAMPAALAEARKNLENPPRIYTQIAIDQLDGNREFFQTAVTAAFADVKDKALLAEFKHVERRRHRRARRLQEVAAGRSAEAIDRRVRDWRRHVSQEARRPTR